MLQSNLLDILMDRIASGSRRYHEPAEVMSFPRKAWVLSGTGGGGDVWAGLGNDIIMVF